MFMRHFYKNRLSPGCPHTEKVYIEMIEYLQPTLKQYLSGSVEDDTKNLVRLGFVITQNVEYLIEGYTPESLLADQHDAIKKQNSYDKKLSKELETFLDHIRDDEQGFRARMNFQNHLEKCGKSIDDAETIFACLRLSFELEEPTPIEKPRNRPTGGRNYFCAKVAEKLPDYLNRNEKAKALVRIVQKLSDVKITKGDMTQLLIRKGL